MYTRYNLAIDLPDDPNVEIDWRLGFTLIFYLGVAYTNSVLANVEQKPGLRVAMGLGIIFCIDEIMVLQDISAYIKEGQKSDASLQRMIQMFPRSYCTFELIMLARIVYFLLFNVICSISITYVQDDNKLRVVQSEIMRRYQKQLTILSELIYKEMNDGKQCNVEEELKKKEYVDIRT